MLDTCMRCNENAVSMTELYCLNCWVDLNSEIDYTQLEQLFITQEAN